MKNFVFTNSIISTGQYPVWSTGTGGSLNCAVHDSPLVTFNACFTSYVFSHNALVASPASYPPSAWPASNFFPTSESAVEFVDYNGGRAGNYVLQSTSPYKGAGTDGKDLGANVAGVNAAVAKVRYLRACSIAWMPVQRASKGVCTLDWVLFQGFTAQPSNCRMQRVI